jgi:hypothetical protein
VAKIDQITQSYLSKAAANPAQRNEICRQAAQTFMGLAQNPRNAHAAKHLSEVGLQFAQAATSNRPPVIEDFEDLLRETAASYEAVGPYGDDPMDLHAHQRELHAARTVVNPGQVFITPETFNRDATLGRSAKIKWKPTDEDKRNGIEQSQTVAFWQGFKKEAQAFTVDINVQFLNDPLTANVDEPSMRPYAMIDYGSDGNKTQVKLDLALGRRFTGVGNYVSILVGIDAPPNAESSPTIQAGASIGVFAAPSVAPVVQTVYIPEVNDALNVNTASDTFQIPMKAAMLLPMLSTLPLGATATIEFIGYDENVVAVVPYQNSPGMMQPIAIPGDAVGVRVLNGPASFAIFRLPFQISV